MAQGLLRRLLLSSSSAWVRDLGLILQQSIAESRAAIHKLLLDKFDATIHHGVQLEVYF